MMENIRFKTHVGADGVLRLELPERLRDRDLEGVLSVVPTRSASKGWPQSFFSEVLGGWKGEPLTRADQGSFETRDKLK